MAHFTTREGATEPILFQCRQLDPLTFVESTVNLTGYTSPELHVKRKESGVATTFTATLGKFDFGTRSNGELLFAPAANDLDDGTYETYIKITTPLGKAINFPSGAYFLLRVLKAY